ncbi:peptidoglycan DD-metalloendopeptidase family protein [Flavobacteriaceae bacterium M23B6Z8]
MNSFLLYVCQTAIVFSGLYLLYKLVWQKLTFHTINRIVLLSLIPISFILPALTPILPTSSFTSYALPVIPDLVEIKDLQEPEVLIKEAGKHFSLSFLLMLLYGIISSLLLLRMVATHLRLCNLKNNGKEYLINGTHLVACNVSSVFSYLNWIFVPKTYLHSIDELVLKHENAHIIKRHSIDLIAAGIYLSLFWWNPLVYSYRKSLKSLHEFEADEAVLKHSKETASYLQLLLNNLGYERPNHLFHHFNHLIIKKRIDMIMKTKSKKQAQLRYLLSVPLLALLLLAFKKPIYSHSEQVNTSLESVQLTKPPRLFPVKDISPKEITNEFGRKFKHPVHKKEVLHQGIDIKAAKGTPVVATANGKVTFAAEKNDWGNLIIIGHIDGYETRYAHLQGFEVTAGQTVTEGDVIGYVGSTGLSSRPHLHYEVHLNGKQVNPEDYFEN